MIHAESVKQWEAETETYRKIIGELREENARLRKRIGELEASRRWGNGEVPAPARVGGGPGPGFREIYGLTLGEMLREGVMVDKSTFDYLRPSDDQMKLMERARLAATTYAEAIEAVCPSGPDKTYILRKLREVAMWVNVAITRDAEGRPRG